MADPSRKISEGIEIDRDTAESEGVPEELDAGVVGPYRFPDPARRRIAGWIYLAVGAALTALAVRSPGFWVMVVLLAVMAVWHMASSWRYGIEQEEALERAAAAVPFAVGHASAAVTFRGVRSRPLWHVVAYSADEPPSRRALVQFDAVTGDQLGEAFVEDVPA